MLGRPERGEAAPYYFGYIDRISSGDIAEVLGTQLDETIAFLGQISRNNSPAIGTRRRNGASARY